MIDIAVSALSLALLARVAWIDFCTLRIPNREVLLLLALSLPLLIPGVTQPGLANLVPGLLLFVLGVVFWLLRMMGAGDAKLFLPLGFLVGWDGVLIFAICLLPFSLVLLGLMKLAKRGALGSGFVARRLGEIATTRGIPYGVPMAASGFAAVLWRLAI